jgi:hypothetical protein
VGELELDPPRGARRVRVPELLVGAALAVGFALAAVLWQANATQRDPVLAVGRSIARGEVIEATDVRVVYVGSDQPLVTLSEAELARVVGRVAVADLPAGTLLTPAHMNDPQTVEPGEGVVGLALDPGQFPAMQLAPGDVVNVVTPGEGGDEGVLAEAAVVFAVEDLGGQGRRFVSLRTSEEAANRVASAAESGPVRLVLVGD